MKKNLIIAAILFTLSASAQKKDSTYDIKLNESQIQMFYKTLEVSKQAIQQSTILMNTGIETIKEVDSLQAVIRKVYIDKNKK